MAWRKARRIASTWFVGVDVTFVFVFEGVAGGVCA
jgi:hypothetical protein